MARFIFGGEITQLTVAPDATNADALKVAPTVAIPLYATVGGSVVTDFLKWDGAAFTITATSISSDADGYLPPFQGPDGVSILYDSAGHALVARDATGSGVPTGGTAGQVLTPSGWAAPSVTAAQISNGTTVGRSVVTAADAAAARTAIGAESAAAFNTDFDSRAATYLPANNFHPIVVLDAGDATTGLADGTIVFRRSATTSGPISFTELTVGNSTTDGTTFTTASVTATTNMRLLIVTTGVGAGGAALNSNAVTGQGLTWTRIGDISNTSSAAGVLHSALFLGTGTATTGTLTIAPGGTVESILWREVDVVNGGSIVQVGTASPTTSTTTPGVTLSGVSGANAVIGFIAQNNNNTLTPGTGFTALGTTNSTTSIIIVGATQYKLVGQNSVTWTGSGTVKRVVIAAEIAPL